MGANLVSTGMKKDGMHAEGPDLVSNREQLITANDSYALAA